MDLFPAVSQAVTDLCHPPPPGAHAGDGPSPGTFRIAALQRGPGKPRAPAFACWSHTAAPERSEMRCRCSSRRRGMPL